MDHRRQTHLQDGPATLFAVMKDAIGKDLRSRYKPAKEMPHQLLVLAMQLNDEKRKKPAPSKSESPMAL